MAVQDVSNSLTYPMAQNYSADKFALTIEKFDSKVHETMQAASVLDGVNVFKPLIGTDTMSNNIMGNPTLQAVSPGVEPEGKKIEVGKNIVQVKTPIIARVTTAMLAEVQDHLDLKSRTPANFGKRIAKSIDEVQFVQIVKSILYNDGGLGTGGILPVGVTTTLVTLLDELDEDKLEAAIMTISQSLMEAEVGQEDGKLYIAPAQYFTLLKNDKLLNTDYSKDNGSYAHAAISVVSGMALVATNRMSQAVDTVASPIKVDSTAALYGSTYETSAAEARIVAAFVTPETIQVAQSIPLTSDVYWDKRLLTWFIDSYLAIGCGPDRTDVGAGIFSTAP